MTESIFDNTTTAQPQVDDYISELTKPGAKFDRTKYASDQEMYQAIARGKYEADLTISLKNREFDHMTNQHKQLRDEYNAGPKLQEVLDKIIAAQSTSSSSTNTFANDRNESAQTQAFDPSQLDTLLSEKLQKIEAAKKAQENTKIVKDKLQAQFGEGFSNMLSAQTQKLGLTKEMVDELVQTAPDTIFRIMGTESKSEDTFQAPPRSTQQQTFAPRNNQRTWAYWKEEARKTPGLFSNPKAHNQMMDDIKAIGEKAFYGSN